ncbi:MAG: universal stress protein, partial [Deltaproteobacteria bacterium]|nr:universal stress protein [Deltaproteobacteria bacterium]
MRILVASDLSGWARTESALLSLNVVPGTSVRLLGLDPEASRSVELSRLLDRQGALSARGLEVERTIGHGRPADEITEEAASWRADLVVAGGPATGMRAGGVAAEVVLRSPVPLLVARSDRFRTLLVADDGSAGARDAARFVGASGLFTGTRCCVATVTETGRTGYLPREMEARLAAGARIAERARAALAGAGLTPEVLLPAEREVDEALIGTA